MTEQVTDVIDKVSPFLSTQVSSLLTNDSRSRPTSEEMLLRLERIKDGDRSEPHHQAIVNDDASNLSPLLECTNSLNKENRPLVSRPCSAKLVMLCGIGLLVILAIGVGTSVGLLGTKIKEGISNTAEIHNKKGKNQKF